MVATHSFKQKLVNALLSIVFLIASGCSEADSSGLSANDFQPEGGLMPIDIWLDNGLDQLDKIVFSDSSYQLFLSLELELKTLRLDFANKRVLQRAVFEDQDQIRTMLFFDKAKLTYSYHKEKSGREWMVAYANNKPYAAANFAEGEWRAVEPYIVPSDQILLSKAMKLSIQYAELEKKSPYQARILNDKWETFAEIEKKEALNYRLNVKKGEYISIALHQAPEHIFFTFSNQATPRMEYKTWSGAADSTGDLVIQVFSTAELRGKSEFTLKVNRQNPIALQ